MIAPTVRVSHRLLADGREQWPLHLDYFSVQRAPVKPTYLAGSESARGAFINDRSTADVASRLRALGDPS